MARKKPTEAPPEGPAAAGPRSRPRATNITDDAPAKPPAAKAADAKAKVKTKRVAKSRAKAGAFANSVVDEDTAFAKLFNGVKEAANGASDGLVTTEQSEKMIIVLPLPSLAMRFLLQQDGITLGRNLMLVGLPGACKSAMLAEMYRWVLLNRGMAGHVETENKDSPDLRNSLLWYNPKLMRRLFYQPANSQEEWMEAIIGWMTAAEKEFAKVIKKKREKQKKGERAEEYRKRTAARVVDTNPGWIYPFIFGIDSLTAVSSDATIQDIRSKGHAERRFQIEAQYLSDFAKTLANLMRGKPIILASTNHLKPGQDPNNATITVDNIPGGRAMRFMNTIELKMVKVGAGVKTAEYSGNRIQLINLKNSLGETGLRINVDMKWWWEVDDETGEPIQRTVWDWDTAAIDTLVSMKNWLSAKNWNALNEVVDIHVPQSGPRTFWSKELGIPSSSPVRFDEAGRILEERQDILDAIYPILHIKHRTRFTPGVDYTDLQELMKRSASSMDRVYKPQELSSLGSATMGLLDEEITAAIKRKEAEDYGGDDDDDE